MQIRDKFFGRLCCFSKYLPPWENITHSSLTSGLPWDWTVPSLRKHYVSPPCCTQECPTWLVLVNRMWLEAMRGLFVFFFRLSRSLKISSLISLLWVQQWPRQRLWTVCPREELWWARVADFPSRDALVRRRWGPGLTCWCRTTRLILT